MDGVSEFSTFLFVLLIPAVGVLASIAVSAIITEGEDITQNIEVEGQLKKQLIYSTVLLIPLIWLISAMTFGDFIFISNAGEHFNKTSFDIFTCIIFGLIAGLIIGYFT